MMMKDCNRTLSSRHICHRLCLCYNITNYVWQKSDEMRAIHTSTFSSHGTRIHSERNTNHSLYTNSNIRYISHSSLWCRQDHPTHSHIYNNGIYHGDTLSSKKTIKNPCKHLHLYVFSLYSRPAKSLNHNFPLSYVRHSHYRTEKMVCRSSRTKLTNHFLRSQEKTRMKMR